MIDEDAGPVGEPAGGGEQRLRRLLVAQVPDHDRAQMLPRFGQRPAFAGRLKDHPRLVAYRFRQRLWRTFLQHDQRLRQRQRALCFGIGQDVAIEVGAGEDHCQPMLRMHRAPEGDRRCRAACMQRDHRRVASRQCVRPVPDDAHAVRAGQMPLPAAGCLPVAVVGVAQRRTDDHQLRRTNGHDFHDRGCLEKS
ncbi:MAG: hypothetical protein CAPSK01_004819 [Candidatus Accumulibacter vicinus]|uniref:Uncharacterized protein n=1 Tax=Candidatus Accumulibacter vicinus TaxID=2954382 RepID=A0A084XU36_9PROT|nr:MAG: hypothetical protein CAPSK01_004819 [Candidatus Accumulibacter vicinus]